MNKREEFVKQLNVLMWYLDPQGVLIPDPLVKKQCRLLNDLYDAAQPSQEGLPELPEPFKYYYTANQMLAYGAQCRAAAVPELTEAMIDAPRGFLMIYGQGGQQLRTAHTRSHCERYRPGSTECWPDWARTGDTGITKAGAAILIWAMMLAAAPKGEGK